jgi:hypothetical protein
MLLSVLQEKLAEAHGLAMAAMAVTAKVEERVDDASLWSDLADLRADAEETRARCLAVERGFGRELAVELLAHANSTKDRAADLAAAWFKAGTDPLRAWSFLAMAEAGEVAVWTAVSALSVAGGGAVAELAAWALPVQERHLDLAFRGIVQLAERTDAVSPRWG